MLMLSVYSFQCLWLVITVNTDHVWCTKSSKDQPYIDNDNFNGKSASFRFRNIGYVIYYHVIFITNSCT